MVCPMRYVVAAVSAVVALLIMWSTDWSGQAETQSNAKQTQHIEWKWLDFFTGRYLWNVYKSRKEMIEHIPATQAADGVDSKVHKS